MDADNVLVKFWKETSVAQKFLFGALLVLPLVLNNMTSPVPNYDNETDTVMYKPNSLAPPAFVSFTWVFSFWVIAILLMLSFLFAEFGEKRLLREDEIKRYFRKYIEEYRARQDSSEGFPLEGTYWFTAVFLVSFTEAGETKFLRWVVGIDFFDKKENVERHFKFWVLPYQLHITKVSEVFTSVGELDQCWRCGGKEYSLKVILPAEADEYRRVKEAMGLAKK